MPSAARDELPLQEVVPGYSSRFTDWGGITVAFEKAHKGQDASTGRLKLCSGSGNKVRPHGFEGLATSIRVRDLRPAKLSAPDRQFPEAPLQGYAPPTKEGRDLQLTRLLVN